MNKIILDDQNFINETDTNINCTFTSNAVFDVSTLNIEVLNDTNLEINYNFKTTTKLEVTINVKKGVKLNIHEIINGESGKIRTTYHLDEETNINTYKFNDIKTIKEYVIIYLNGKDSNINYNLKTIAIEPEKYDILVYHNAKNTNSNINNNGVNLQGNININVSSFVKKGNKNCNVNQSNRIINLTNQECIIKPNLYIDEFDVSANHSALIGNFNSDELFYMMSRGITKEEAIKLLIKGFLTSNMNITKEQKENIIGIISKYWR